MRRAAAVLLLVTACASDSDPAMNPPGLTVAVARERLFEAQRAFEVTFVNDGPTAYVITESVLVSHLFEPVAPDDRTVTVHPTGDPISVPVPYGPAVCDDESPDPELGLQVRRDGEPAQLVVGEASAGILRVHAAECAAAEVAESVVVGWGDTWDPAGAGRVHGRVTVEPVGDAEATVQEIAASVVFAVEVRTPLPAADDVDVVISAARCDAHALTESKKTYRFPLWVRVGDGERVRLELEAKEGPVRAALDRAIEECVAARTGA